MEDAAGFFTALLVVVGAFQLGVFVWQLRLIRGSLEEAKRASTVAQVTAEAAKETAQAAKSQAESARLQLRAFVAVTGVKILHADGEWQPNVRVTYKNCGRTPAYGLENRASVIFAATEAKPSFSYLEDQTSYFDLFPEQDRTITMQVKQADWNPRKDAVRTGQLKFFVYGDITYKDAFGEPRFTRFRLQLSPDDEGIKEDSFVFCAEGNESN